MGARAAGGMGGAAATGRAAAEGAPMAAARRGVVPSLAARPAWAPRPGSASAAADAGAPVLATDIVVVVGAGAVGAVVADEIGRRTGKETRVCVLGHLQRGGAPTTFDRLLCTRFGVNAVRLIAEEKYGFMVAHRPPDTDAIPLTEAIGRLRTVPLDGDILRTGRALGISFGDAHTAPS